MDESDVDTLIKKCQERSDKHVSDLSGEVKMIRTILLGNGKVEDSVVFILQQLRRDMQTHCEAHKKDFEEEKERREKLEGRTWDIKKSILVYFLTGAISSIIMYLLTTLVK
jgi:ribosomal protein S15P/S13E